VTINDTRIFEKKIVSFDFHGTLLQRIKGKKHHDVSEQTTINFPIFQIFKHCLKLGIKTYIISYEPLNGNESIGVDNNLRILKDHGIIFPKENIFCTDFKSKDQWFIDTKTEFHIDDDIGVVLLARQMRILGLLVDYKDHPISSMFTRINLNGKVTSGDLQ
jgi:hypothetical protein